MGFGGGGGGGGGGGRQNMQVPPQPISSHHATGDVHNGRCTNIVRMGKYAWRSIYDDMLGLPS